MATSIARSVLLKKHKSIHYVRLSTFLSNNVCGKDLRLSTKIGYYSCASHASPVRRLPRCVQAAGVGLNKSLSTHSLGDNVQYEDVEGVDCDLRSPDVFEPVSPDKGAQELLLIRPPEQPENPRCIRVVIIGTPNAGKSTLVNTLLGRRICAVSKKVHTTRRQATAVLTEHDTQVIILDTPGMVTKQSARRHALPRELIISPKSSLELADLIVVIVDVADKWTCNKMSTDILMELGNFQETPCILVLNKVDNVKNKQSLVELTALLTEGIVDGKPIEMSGRLTKKLLRNKGFRRKYLQYKGLSNSEEADESSGGDERLMSVEEEQSEMATSPDKLERLSGSSNTSEFQFNSEEEASDIIEDVRLDSEDDETDNVNENGHELAPIRQNDAVGMNLEKVELLNQYINHLCSVSKVYRSKERENTEAKQQQLGANRRRQELFKEYNERSGWHLFEKVFMISAKSGDGVQELKEFVIGQAKPEEWEYHKKVVTDLSPMEILEEAIREQLLECLPQEIPYNIDQHNTLWEYNDDGILLINQRLTCYKKSHYGAILRRIRTIAKLSEQDLMNAFHCDILLKLSVKLAK